MTFATSNTLTADPSPPPASATRVDAAAAPADQTALTVVAEVKPAALDALRTLLLAMGDRAAAPADRFPFARLPTVHFGRFVLLEPAVDLQNNPLPPMVVFGVDFDGPLDAFLRQLVSVAGAKLDAVFGHCADYPAADATDAARIDFILRHHVKADAAYVNWVGRSVGQVRQEALLRERIEAFLDGPGGRAAGPDARSVRAAVQQFVRGEPSLAWARNPLPPMPLAWRLREAATVVLLVAAALVLAPFAAVALPFFLIVLRMHERADVPSTARPDVATLERLAALEDHVVQNQFSAVGRVKPGWFRRTLLAAGLFALNVGARHLFSRGDLAGVKTIHFARWVFVNDKRRLVFASNYDGSLESYMDDFIDKVAWGLNAVFSNGEGYPRTNWLLFQGAEDEQAFKNFLHNHQIPTQVWYSAYPGLTALNILNNAKVRAGLYGDMDEQAAAAWLGLL